MIILTDENVPDGVGQVFSENGYEVIRIRDVFPPQTPDETVAQYANTIKAVVVTWDKDFLKILTRQSYQRYRHAGKIIYSCRYQAGRTRTQHLMSVVKLEFDEQSRLTDKRTFIEISGAHYKVER